MDYPPLWFYSGLLDRRDQGSPAAARPPLHECVAAQPHPNAHRAAGAHGVAAGAGVPAGPRAHVMDGALGPGAALRWPDALHPPVTALPMPRSGPMEGESGEIGDDLSDAFDWFDLMSKLD